jgi:hypothetical protein
MPAGWGDATPNWDADDVAWHRRTASLLRRGIDCAEGLADRTAIRRLSVISVIEAHRIACYKATGKSHVLAESGWQS